MSSDMSSDMTDFRRHHRIFVHATSRSLRLVQANSARFSSVLVALSLAVCCQVSFAGEEGSPIPFVLPERVPFIVPDRSSVIPEPVKPMAPEDTKRLAPDTGSSKNSGDTPSSSRARSSRRARATRQAPSSSPESSSKPVALPSESNLPQASDAAAAASPSSLSLPSSSSAAPSSPSESSSSTASPSSPPPSTDSVSGGSGKRFILQGKTEVIDFRLSDFDSYKQGMAALDKRRYAEAETLFKAAAAKLDDGYEKYRAECNFFEAKCMMMQGKFDQSATLLKAAIAVFEQHDPRNPYKLAAERQVADLISGKARMDVARLQSQASMQRARISVDQNITLYSRLAADDSDPVLLRVDKDAVPTTIHDCFAEMTCLETAEIGSNVSNAVGRWQPLLVKGEPAAIEFGAKPPVINVKVNGQMKEVTVNLPMVNGLRRILLATDNEKVAAIDVDNNDTWLLLMDAAPDGTVGHFRWALLRHAKQKSATWGVSRGTLNKQRPTGNAWGTAPHNGFGRETGSYDPRLYRNSQGKY